MPLALFPPFSFHYFFFVFSPTRKKKVKKREKKEKYERPRDKRERVVASIKKKTKRALFLFLSSFSRVNMAVTLSGSRFFGAFSSCDSAIINGTSALVVACFFIISFEALFLRTYERPNKERKKNRKKTEERDEESRRDGDH